MTISIDEIREKVRRRRRILGLTLSQAAREVGVSTATFRKFEMGNDMAGRSLGLLQTWVLSPMPKARFGGGQW
jgi:transcriptional regulator with XRE-family HTH domain